MGYIKEPGNVDLVVGPSVLTEASKQTIAQAIARYKKTGQKTASLKLITQGSTEVKTFTGHKKTTSVPRHPESRRKAKL